MVESVNLKIHPLHLYRRTFIDSTIHRINDNFNQLHDIIQPPTRGTSVLEPSQNFLSMVRARSKKWLCAEEAPTYCGSRGQLSTTSHFSKVVGMSNPSLMACGLIKIPFTLYHVDTYARSSLFLNGDDGPFHLLATYSALAFVKIWIFFLFFLSQAFA
ncbi:hypothetical protein V1477_014236, partial [Vespula maculifrons]